MLPNYIHFNCCSLIVEFQLLLNCVLFSCYSPIVSACDCSCAVQSTVNRKSRGLGLIVFPKKPTSTTHACTHTHMNLNIMLHTHIPRLTSHICMSYNMEVTCMASGATYICHVVVGKIVKEAIGHVEVEGFH